MDVKNYRIKGKFKMGENRQPFAFECRSVSEKEAREKVYAKFGTKHANRRHSVRISSIEEIEPGEARNLEVIYYSGE